MRALKSRTGIVTEVTYIPTAIDVIETAEATLSTSAVNVTNWFFNEYREVIVAEA